MKRVGTKAWCAIALGLLVISGCRFRYEELELLPSDGIARGGDGATAGGASGPDGGAGSDAGEVAGEGGAGGFVAAAGTAGATAGSGGAGASAGGGSTNAGASGAPGQCEPDATCSCGAFEGREYRFCSVVASRDTGLIACQAANMSLIRIDSAEENAWLLQQFVDHGMFIGSGGPIVLLGGSDLEAEGMWRWDDGTLFWDGAPVGDLYTNFGSPPRNGQGDCLGMTSDGKWVGRACNSGNATVGCESA